MKTHDEMIGAWKKDPAFQKAYDALGEEFALFDELFKDRSIRREQTGKPSQRSAPHEAS